MDRDKLNHFCEMVKSTDNIEALRMAVLGALFHLDHHKDDISLRVRDRILKMMYSLLIAEIVMPKSVDNPLQNG